MLISIEKVGPSPAGTAHSASGMATDPTRARAECLFDLGAARGVPSLGIEDTATSSASA
ncbi:MAG TPA: hypothetical protein VGN83_13825 [Falsiroseomonas sp.]|nr:hypothetical protein [Falsiroseomonas sp.]